MRVNALVVSAHHDDLELGCGGTVARLLEGGHHVTSLVLTHSGYTAPGGKVIRDRAQALAEGREAARALGYELVAFEEDTMDLQVTDANVCRILEVLERGRIDTLYTHWRGDTHPVHQRITTMALQASRRVPRVFGFAVNWYLGAEAFHPTTFVALEDRHWEKKLQALGCYRSEFDRAGAAWVEYHDRQALNFGTQLGVKRAEGFVTIKNLQDF